MGIKIGEPFKDRVKSGLDDSFTRDAIRDAQNRLRNDREKAASELDNWEEWRKRRESIRRYTIQHLDYYLDELSENVKKLGGHVFFAQTKEEATDYIQQVVWQKEGKKIVKSKSMVTEEINLNQTLESMGCDVVETNLGEYILQIDDHEPPSHFLAPALHKTRE